MKKHIFFLSLFIACFRSLYAAGTIEECSSIQKLLSLASPTFSQLIILDIDNTLYRPKQMVGSDEWFDYTLQQEQKNAPHESKQKVLTLWTALQMITKVIPMESKTVDVINTLQQKHCLVMAMTTRGSNLAFSTFRQLSSLDIHLEKSEPTHVRFQLNKLPDVHYGNGVLFSNGHHKGETLKEFFTQLQWTPKQIIYINDKKEPLEEVQNSLPDSIDFLGLRYSKADQFVQQFKPDIASKELEAFTSLLSDQEAQDECRDPISITKR